MSQPVKEITGILSAAPQESRVSEDVWVGLPVQSLAHIMHPATKLSAS